MGGIAAGDAGAARAHFEAAKKLAQARGLSYRPLSNLLNGPLEDLLERIKALDIVVMRFWPKERYI